MAVIAGAPLVSSDRLLARELRRIDRLLAPPADAVAAARSLDDPPVVLPGLARTAGAYDLAPFDRDLLLLIAAPAIDHGYAARIRALAGAAAPPLGFYVELAIRGGRAPRDFALSRTAAGAPLFRCALLERGPGDAVTVPDPVWRRIVGIDGGCAFESIERRAVDALVLAPAAHAAFDRAAAWASGRRGGVVAITGCPGSGRSALAAALADALGRGALRVRATDDPAVIAREASWFEAVPVVDGDAAPRELAWLAEISGIAIVLGDAGSLDVDAPIFELAAEPPGRAERYALWRRALPAGTEPALVERAAARRLGPGRIATAGRRLAAADAADAPAAAPSLAAIHAACRTVERIAADRVEPRFALADLVLPAAARRELELAIAWGRQLDDLAARGGPHLAAQRGLACLFWGPPGTGKTTAAQVLASELGRELYRVDLSRVVDKYIGETEKHLARIFEQAEAHDFALLFDEADALFGRRTDVRDAHDRFANIETSYLLQRIEQHRGVAILATNLRNNLDAAFLRRLQIVAEFPLPGPAERRALWQRCVPAARAADVDLALLADRFALSGGDIRNAVLAALVLAGDAPVAMRHLAIGVWREQARSGRLLDGSELGPWQRDVASWLGRGS